MNNFGKIGRNDPCPCGSGKKYKNCCGFVESLIHFSKAADSIRFTKQISYLGDIGAKREAFCRRYFEHKKQTLEFISEAQIQKAKSTGKAISCRKGCTICCDELIRSSLQEGEVIAYYLYQHDSALNSFIKAFPRWLSEVYRHGQILIRMEETQSKGFDGQINFEQMQSSIGEESVSYWKLHIHCPFLTDNLCSIYEVRPWTCATVFSTELCTLSGEGKYYWLKLPPEVELPFWDDRLEVVYTDIMPNMVYKILTGSFQFLSQLPGLDKLPKEFYNDPAVKQFAENLSPR